MLRGSLVVWSKGRRKRACVTCRARLRLSKPVITLYLTSHAVITSRYVHGCKQLETAKDANETERVQTKQTSNTRSFKAGVLQFLLHPPSKTHRFFPRHIHFTHGRRRDGNQVCKKQKAKMKTPPETKIEFEHETKLHEKMKLLARIGIDPGGVPSATDRIVSGAEPLDVKHLRDPPSRLPSSSPLSSIHTESFCRYCRRNVAWNLDLEYSYLCWRSDHVTEAESVFGMHSTSRR